MEALVLTLVLLGLTIPILVLLGRSWPRSSADGGFRARLNGERDAHSEEQAPGVREDDDVRWDWRDDRR